ncbi:MAG TPA: NAD(P)H-binding protein [Steroidobacteraceae bacterium]|nr:NAD(P)H-binding protein [Steroidobacteraceae bacterium]
MYVVTGVGGYIGAAVVENLLKDGVAAYQIRVTSRNEETLVRWRARGVEAHKADFNDKAALIEAFQGADHVFMVSTMEAGPSRQQQHRNAVEAAKRAGVGHIVYTSFLTAGKPEVDSLEVADHKLTEQLLRDSGIPWNFMRNNQYADAMAENQAAIAIGSGRSISNTGHGKVGFVARDDVAAVAAKLLQGLGEPNTAYDITGPEALDFSQVADLIKELSGATFNVIDLSDEDMYTMWDSLGVPREATGDFSKSPVPWCSDGMVSFGRMIRDGHLDVVTDVVERFTGSKPKSLRVLMLERRHLWPQVSGS